MNEQLGLRRILYIASTLSNHERVKRLRDLFAAEGVGLTYDWTEHHEGSPYVPDPKLLPGVAERELKGVIDAQVVLVVLPGGGGTHFEMSAAFMMKKPIVILDDISDNRRVSFHYLEGVKRCESEALAIGTVLDYLLRDVKIEEPHPLNRLLPFRLLPC